MFNLERGCTKQTIYHYSIGLPRIPSNWLEFTSVVNQNTAIFGPLFEVIKPVVFFSVRALPEITYNLFVADVDTNYRSILLTTYSLLAKENNLFKYTKIMINPYLYWVFSEDT